MSRLSQYSQPLKKTIVLGLSIALVAGAALVTIKPERAAAASPTTINQTTSSAIYNKFERYVKNASTLATARNYLINNIGRVSVSQATIMTLHLENAQKAQLDAFSEKWYPENIQKIINQAYQQKGDSFPGLLSVVKDSKTRALLIETRDKGYKLKTSEGMYYPVMHYQGFQQFKSHVKKDIAVYIDVMAVESNNPMMNDGAIVIGWDEVIDRALQIEDFLKNYPNSNRGAVIRNEFSYMKSRVFYGASNTPVYDSADGKVLKLETEVREAYEAAIAKDTGGSKLIESLEQLLDLLDGTDGVRTKEVDTFLEQVVEN
ncbi:MAG: hypothetical protein ACE3L7_06480 [Candidatus Pristimantibacillus sp.]